MKMKRELKKLYKKDRNIGEIPYDEMERMSNRVDHEIDAIVKEVIKENNIDIYYDYPYIMYDRIVLSETLLLGCHPIVSEKIKEIRKTLGIHNLYPYKKELVFDDLYSDETFVDKSFDGIDDNIKQKLYEQLNLFFLGLGKKISKSVWMKPLALRILTGMLPMPDFAPEEQFKIVNHCIVNSIYPTIILKRRIKKRELNPLITFIREHENELVEATENLPELPIKRFDIDLTKLAISLWVFENEENGTTWMMDWIDKKYNENEKFFGEYEFIIKAELPNFKSDALFYLNQMLPITS